MARMVGLVNLWLQDEQARRMKVMGRNQSFEVRVFGLVAGVVQADLVVVRRGTGSLVRWVQG
jgi:hypothetical protein